MPKKISLTDSSEELSISLNNLGAMISRYKTERLQMLPQNLIDDTTSVWISKSKILEFFQKNPNAEGIRFYFGVVDDPFINHGIHNIVLISTSNNREDQVSENDSVLITQNFESFPLDGALHALLCPPPIDRCNGRAF
jgi:hypothetical protein